MVARAELRQSDCFKRLKKIEAATFSNKEIKCVIRRDHFNLTTSKSRI